MESRPIFSHSMSSLSSSVQDEFSDKSTKKLSSSVGSAGILACIKKRHVLTIYAFFGFFFAYAMRANLSVAIVDMSKSEAKADEMNVLAEDNLTKPIIRQSPEWSPILQGYVLSSFFYGYIFTQLPAGTKNNFL